MSSFARMIPVAFLLAASTPAAAHAQKWGWMLDKIQELSGPEMTYYGLFVRLGGQPGTFEREDRGSGLVWRLAAFYGTDDKNDERQGGVDVTAWRAQLTAEYQVALPIGRGVNLGLESGISGHYFDGDIDESFLHPSIPLQINLYPFAGCRGWLLHGLSAGAGFHFFPPFDPGDFAPIPDFETEDWDEPAVYRITVELGSFSDGPFRC